MSRKPKTSSESSQDLQSGISSIAELALQAREDFLKPQIVKLEALNLGLSQSIDNLLKTLDQKDDEIRHLKQLLVGSQLPTFGEVSRILLSDEEIIAEKQLGRLRNMSMERDLTLDEVKRFDLLVKNKRLAQGNATTIESKPVGLPKDMSNDQLMKLASKKIEE
jgi:hypothetical protein